MKTYSAQSGYVYQYFYQGHRPCGAGSDSGTEFVFSLSADRKNWHSVSVVVEDSAIAHWEQSHARDLSGTERYAVAKIALFQAFDERSEPGQMNQDIHVRIADVEAIVDTLGL
jgi:hypothetical protein